MRIVDAQQIFMQEPRASWEGAQLIAQGEFQKEIIRQRLLEANRQKARQVTRPGKARPKPAIVGKPRPLKGFSRGQGRIDLVV